MTDADEASRRAVAERATTLGATRVDQLFPGATDPALRSLYVIDLPDAADVRAVTGKLRNERIVESVELELKRWLT